MKPNQTKSKLYTLSPRCTSGQRLDTLYTLLFYLSILFFIIGFNFSDSPPPSGWYQQFMPDLNNKQLRDITFIDSLNGYAITGYNTVDTNYILRTSNGGDNWVIINTVYAQLTRIQFLNSNTGYVSGGNIQGGYLIKTTNGGINWDYVPNSSFTPRFEDMFVLNENTIWVASTGGLNGGIFRTTNGGANWDLQYYQFNNNPGKIYMYNQNIGFACTNFELLRTSDGGSNWTQIGGISQGNRFFEMYFIDSLTGWRANDTIKKSTDGGLNWTNQQIPRGPNISYGIYSFSVINRDTIWGTGGIIEYPNLQGRGILYRTTNGGNNWQFQIPDTTINIYGYGKIRFINKNVGWAYGSSRGIHTITGGDSTFYTSIEKIQSRIPQDFSLYQNYPNPFNPDTRITYSIKSNEKGKMQAVKLAVYDITGRQIKILINEKQNPGTYEVSFNGANLSSGVYFYSLFAEGVLIDTKKMILVK